jgi:hypothetical protein
MGGTCSVPVKQVYGVHTGTSDVIEKQKNHVFVKGSAEPVEKEETVRRITLSFRGEDGRTYTMTRFLALDEPDTFTHRLKGRLKLYPYLDSTNQTDVYDFISASRPGLPPDIWKDSDGRLMNNKGRPVCNDAKKPNFFADNFHTINILSSMLSMGVVVVIGMTMGPGVASSVSLVSSAVVSIVYLVLFASWFRSF